MNDPEVGLERAPVKPGLEPKRTGGSFVVPGVTAEFVQQVLLLAYLFLGLVSSAATHPDVGLVGRIQAGAQRHQGVFNRLNVQIARPDLRHQRFQPGHPHRQPQFCEPAWQRIEQLPRFRHRHIGFSEPLVHPHDRVQRLLLPPRQFQL